MAQAWLELRPGDPLGGKPLLAPDDPRFGPPVPNHGTTTCLAADAAGNFVAATPSGRGGVPAAPTGVWLNSRLQSFNTWPHSPNRILPGKRPRITLSPTLVLKAGRPVLAIGVAGGDGQDQAALLRRWRRGDTKCASLRARFGTCACWKGMGRASFTLRAALALADTRRQLDRR